MVNLIEEYTGIAPEAQTAMNIAGLPLSPLTPVNPEKYLNGVRYRPHPDDLLVPPVLLQELKYHPTAIPVFQQSMKELQRKKRSGGDTKMFQLVHLSDGYSYVEDPQNVQDHTWYVVEKTSQGLTDHPDLQEIAGIPHHWAVLMAASHDIGEGSSYGDFPASARPENYFLFHKQLAKTGKKHLLVIEQGNVVGLNPDPAVQQEIADAWVEMEGTMRRAEEDHAQGLVEAIPYYVSKDLVESLRQRFEERDQHPDDLLSHYVRTRDISAEFEAYTTKHGWEVAPYTGHPEQVAAMLQRSIDISIARMMKSAACLAHTMPWPAVQIMQELIEADFRKLYKTDFPEKGDQAIAYLQKVWHEALIQARPLEDHLAEIKQKAWLQ